MLDPLSREERSALMAKVRGRGGKSTERRVEAALVQHGFKDWVDHPNNIPGRPDFYFAQYRLVMFVDGCFWHACPKCARRVPRTRTEFWKEKITENRRRDDRTRRKLRASGYHVIRIWEHQVPKELWVKRLRSMMKRAVRDAIATPGAPSQRGRPTRRALEDKVASQIPR
jgi:DNA mismatch endonuclease (patch repair protein)